MSPGGDYRDLCIEAFADSERHLLDRVVDLTVERDAYQLLVRQLLSAFHAVTKKYNALREQVRVERERERGATRAA